MNFLIKENVALAELTTFKIGGKARFFASATNEKEIIEALEFAEGKDLKIFILGGGSNVLIADEGFDGLVLQVALKGISISEEENGKVFVEANAGEDWDDFVSFCIEKNLQGVECLSGIPGFVGGTPLQNVGAYGQEVSETIVSVRVLDRKTKQIKELTGKECGFAYRTSIFNTAKKDCFVVLAVTYSLRRGGEPKIVYRDLQNYFGEKKPDLREMREAVLQIRWAKSMVVDKNDPNSRSAGSFFKNPIVSKERFKQIEERAKKLRFIKSNEKFPRYEFDEKNIKIPAAWLIEKSGFHKGFLEGAVGLSTKHTLAIVNAGNASARDVLRLKERIQSEVEKKFGVSLKPELNFIGFEETN